MLLYLDIETNLAHTHIWMCVTKNADTGEVQCHTAPATLLKLLEQKPLLCAHNGIGFDFYLLNKLWNTKIRLSQCIDTLVLSRLHNPVIEGGHSLATWAQRLGMKKIDYNEFDNPDLVAMEEYCREDVHILHRLHVHLKAALERDGFSQKSIDIEHTSKEILSRQERTGWLLDMKTTMDLRANLAEQLADIDAWFQQRWPPEITERVSVKTGKQLKPKTVVFNPGSRQMLAQKLIECGWKPTVKTESGQWKVDEKTLDGVEIPEAKKALEYLTLQKRLSQVESWIEEVQDDGRVHGRVEPMGAVTGRCTHSSPNMSQVPSVKKQWGKECRECWVCPEGKLIVGIDLSGIELRCLAHYMNDPAWTKELIEGDIHTKNQQAAGLATRDQAKTFILMLG